MQDNRAFLLHAGDCAESFEACTHVSTLSPLLPTISYLICNFPPNLTICDPSQENITAKIGLILSFSLILIWGGRLPVVRIGRIAGQYAKPRSSAIEKLEDGREVPSFRGDNVNE